MADVPAIQRSVTSSILALVAAAAYAASASAATHAAVISSFSPAQVRVGQPLVITGRNFRKGAQNSHVFFSRASDGKTVRARPSQANSTRRMTVVVPASATGFLTVVN